MPFRGPTFCGLGRSTPGGRGWLLRGLGTSWPAPAPCRGKTRDPLVSGIVLSRDFQARHPFGPQDCTGAWFVPLLRGPRAGSEVGSSSFSCCHCRLEWDLSSQGLSVCMPSPGPLVTQHRGKGLSETSSFLLGPARLPAPVDGQGSWQSLRVESLFTIHRVDSRGNPIRFDLGLCPFSLGL